MWYSGNYGIELQITKAQAQNVIVPGRDCSAEIEILAKEPKIKRQLKKIDPVKLKTEFKKYVLFEV